MNLVIAATNGQTPTIYTEAQLKTAARILAKEQTAQLRGFHVRVAPYPSLKVDLTRDGFHFQKSLAI